MGFNKRKVTKASIIQKYNTYGIEGIIHYLDVDSLSSNDECVTSII